MIRNHHGLPLLLNKYSLPQERTFQETLNLLDETRRKMYSLWLDTASGVFRRKAHTGILDDMILLLLVATYVNTRSPQSLPKLSYLLDTKRPTSFGEIVNATQGACRCNLLTKVFACFDKHSNLRPPIPVITTWLQLAETPSVIAACGRFPASLLGAFHERCRANPIIQHTGASQSPAPSMRSQQGVFYTPAAIVDFIVSRVVGKKIASLPLQQLAILDPSCGCGAFLVASLRLCLEQTSSKIAPVDSTPGRRSASDIANKSTRSLDEYIQLAHSIIHGCDIDAKALSVATQLLLLTIWDFALSSFPESVINGPLRIPNFCDKLIRADFLRLNPTRLKALWASRGFDVIVGGPPFVRLQRLHRLSPQMVNNYRKRFRTASKGQFDLYMMFVEQALHLLRKSGRLGLSISSTFLRSVSGANLRGLIADNCTVDEIVEFENRWIYPDAITQIALLIGTKRHPIQTTRHTWIAKGASLRRSLGKTARWSTRPGDDIRSRELVRCACHTRDWSLMSPDEAIFLEKLHEKGTMLGQLPVAIHTGVCTGDDHMFLLRPKASPDQNTVLVKSRRSPVKLRLEKNILQPILRGRDIRGFDSPEPRAMCLFPCEREGIPISEPDLHRSYPLTHRYLTTSVKTSNTRQNPHSLAKTYAFVKNPRRPNSLSPVLVAGNIGYDRKFTLMETSSLLFHNSVVLIYPSRVDIMDPFYMLGILNSRVMWSYMKLTSPTMGEGRHVYRVGVLRRFPLFVPRSQLELAACHRIRRVAKRLLLPDITLFQRKRSLSELDRRVERLYGVANVASAR